MYIAENFSLIQKMFYLIAEKFQKNSFESIIDGKLQSNGNQFLTKYHKELNLHNILYHYTINLPAKYFGIIRILIISAAHYVIYGM